MVRLNKKSLEREARKAGLSKREYCLQRINYWRQMLDEISDDYTGLSEDEFMELVEKEVDSFKKERNNE